MSGQRRLTRLQHLFAEHSPVTWSLPGAVVQGRVAAHEESGNFVFVTIAWEGGRSGRFIEAHLPPGLTISGGAHEKTQPMPAVRGRT